MSAPVQAHYGIYRTPKVTAVQVRRTNRPSDWQAKFFEEDVALTRIEVAQGASD